MPEETQSVAPVAQAAPAPVINSSQISSWPGGFGSYKFSREAVKVNLGTLLILILVNYAASFVISLIFGKSVLIYELLSLLISILFLGATIYTYIKAVRGEKIDFKEALNKSVKVYVNLLLLYLLVVLCVVGGLILLIIPGIYIGLRLSLSFYFLVDQDLGVMEAFKASWEATNGHLGKMLGIIGAAIVMALPIITIIGIPVSIYLLFMYGAVWAVLYQYVINTKDKMPVASKTTAPEPTSVQPA